jgi:hypothetical protein
MGILRRLSPGAAGGIPGDMDCAPARLGLLPLTLLLAVAAAGACGVRPLRSADLYGAAGAGAPAGAAGSGAGGHAVAGAGGLGPAGAGGPGGSGGLSVTDAAVDEGTPDAPPDAPPAEAGADGAQPPCGQPCKDDEFCDELTGRCAPRTGVGMLSGMVVDPCSGVGLDARIGIAGQRQCSAVGKGSFFFTGLPLGRLKLAATKDGYELYGATVDVVPGGVVHDIRLARTGGCESTPSVVACTCTEPSCDPRTPSAP